MRELIAHDSKAIQPIITDPTTIEYTATGVLTADQAEDFLQQCQNQYISCGFGYRTIELKATQQLVGLCGLNQHTIDGIEHLHLNY